MAFDIRLWLYPGANPDSDPALWGLEENISAYIRRPGQDGGQSISYSGGKGDEAPSVDAGQMSLTLDNRDGRFSTDNLTGPYFGRLDINNPVRMGVVSFADTFNRSTSNGWGSPDAALGKTWTITGTASSYATDGAKATVIIPAANSAQTAVAGNGGAKDVDVTVTVIPTAVATGARFAAGIRLRATDASHYLLPYLSFDLAGSLQLAISVFNGTTSTLTTLNPIPSATYTAGQRWKLRAQADGNAIRVKAWPEASAEPATWHLTGTDTTATGTDVGLYMARFSGNTNSGITSIMGIDDFTAVGIEFTGTVVSWPLRWDRTGNNSWAPITAAGILRRIRQGTYPIQSPLRRQLAATADVTGYWPLEDGADAQQFSSAIRGQLPAEFNGVSPATENSLAGGGTAPTLDTANGVISMSTRTPNNGNGMSAMFFAKLGSLTSTLTRIARIRASRGPARIFDILVQDIGWTTTCYDDAGSQVGSTFTVWPSTMNVSDWIAFQLETETGLTALNTDVTTIIHQVGATSYYAQGLLVVGTTNTNVSGISLHGPQGTAFAHVWLGKNTLPFVDNDFSLVSSGYVRETAADRFARVCTEAGIPYILRPGTSEAMGAQREAGTLAVLESCVQADYGVMAERGAGLEYIPREARWNAAVTMAITVAAGQVAAPPEPVRDDQRLRTKWTVNRLSGGQGSFEDTAASDKYGTWEDSTSINVADDSVLENHAGFRVAIGTGPRLRWPSVALNFARNPTLLPAWRARGYGWRLTIATGKGQVTGHEPDLIVEGFSASLDPDMWTVDLSCTSADIWRSAVTDDTGILGRADNEYCQTTALISATAMTIPITTTSGTRWDNTASLWTGGVDFNIGGERVTVTSITNGVNPAQTLNVSARGVNGAALSHPSGTEVHLWHQAIVAL